MSARSAQRARQMVMIVAVLVVAGFVLRRHVPLEVGDGVPTGRPIVSPDRAAAHVGEILTVCGRVVDGAYVPAVRGEPTFLNFGAPHPNETFNAVIFGEHRRKFPTAPELEYRGAAVCVTGEIRHHGGVPQIQVRDPAQIRFGRSAGTRTHGVEDEDSGLLPGISLFTS